MKKVGKLQISQSGKTDEKELANLKCGYYHDGLENLYCGYYHHDLKILRYGYSNLSYSFDPINVKGIAV